MDAVIVKYPKPSAETKDNSREIEKKITMRSNRATVEYVTKNPSLRRDMINAG